MNKKVKHGTLLTVIFTLLSLLYLYPIILVFINSFKKKVYISKAPFEIPTGKMYVGLENYTRGIKQTADSGIWMEFIYHNLICSSDYLMLLHVCMVYLPREDKIYKDLLHALPVCNDRAIPDGNVYIIQDRKYASYGKSVGTGCDLPWIWCRTFRLYVYRVHEIHSIGD